MQASALVGGFDQPVFGAQTVFRALMDALANPGEAQSLGVDMRAPPGLAPELAALALTLCDHDTPLWLDPVLGSDAAIVEILRFHTGAPLAQDPGRAQFALVSGAKALPRLETFALGTDEYPDRSTTMALALPSLTGGPVLTLRGPGIRETRAIAPVGLPADFLAQWSANRALFPRGVDLLLVAGGEVIGLPRTTRITEG